MMNMINNELLHHFPYDIAVGDVLIKHCQEQHTYGYTMSNWHLSRTKGKVVALRQREFKVEWDNLTVEWLSYDIDLYDLRKGFIKGKQACYYKYYKAKEWEKHNERMGKTGN